jgi:hypothetical protein
MTSLAKCPDAIIRQSTHPTRLLLAHAIVIWFDHIIQAPSALVSAVTTQEFCLNPDIGQPTQLRK